MLLNIEESFKKQQDTWKAHAVSQKQAAGKHVRLFQTHADKSVGLGPAPSQLFTNLVEILHSLLLEKLHDVTHALLCVMTNHTRTHARTPPFGSVHRLWHDTTTTRVVTVGLQWTMSEKKVSYRVQQECFWHAPPASPPAVATCPRCCLSRPRGLARFRARWVGDVTKLHVVKYEFQPDHYWLFLNTNKKHNLLSFVKP